MVKLVSNDWQADERARQRIREDLGSSFLVEAAAGTGKTTLLVDRLVAVLRAGEATVDGIVAVTFTRKAAGELKLRLRQRLDEVRLELRPEAGEPVMRARERVELQRIDAAVEHLEEARIGTIHSFCAEILRERPVEAGVDPGFVELADEAPALLRRAFDRWIQEQLDVMPPGLRRALSMLALFPSFDGSSPIDRLRFATGQLAEWRDFPAPWLRTAFDREAMIDGLVTQVRRVASYARRCQNTRDDLKVSLEPMVLLDEWIARGTGFGAASDFSSGNVAEADYDALEARLMELHREMGRWNRRKKGRGKFAEALPRDQVIAERDELVEALRLFREAAGADLAALLHQELQGALAAYDVLKRREGKLDFTDLVLGARDLLRRDEGVRADLQQRFSHVFVDEFQDTDPLQAEVLLLLVSDDPAVDDWRRVRPVPGKLFLVGDPKQSIYRFRRADIQLYQSIQRQLAEAGVELLELNRSFRSVAAIQRLVNHAFESEMDGDVAAGRPRYIPLAEHRNTPKECPALVALPVPNPYGTWRTPNGKAIEASLPDAVGAFCHWLIHSSGWQVQDLESRQLRAIESSDVCILFRRFVTFGSDVTRPYTRALEARGVSHLLLGQRTFHRREEVETLRAALSAIEWPHDQLLVFAMLRGSLFSFADDQLLRFRAFAGGFSPARWRAAAKRQAAEQNGEDTLDLPRDLQEIGEVLELLDELHRRRNRRAVVETVQDLLERTRAHAGFAMRPAGHQVLANVERVCDLARSYEVGGGRSFRGFVEQLDEQASRPSSTEAAVVEEGAEGVRLMTVHSAKGLEFPIVILADPAAKIAPREPDRTVDASRELCAMRLLGLTPLDLRHAAELEAQRDRAEGVRVAYVAATRARDLLVVPTVGDGPIDESWIAPLWKAVYPPTSSWRQASASTACPEFGEASVLHRPIDMDGLPEGSVRPGTHRFAEAAYDVVWWDPAALELGAPFARGLWREELLSPEEGAGGEDAASPTEPALSPSFERWKERQAAVRAVGSAPSAEVASVTELDEEPPGGLRPLRIEGLASGAELPERPSGLRFGDLVHSLLQLAPFAALPHLEAEALEQTIGDLARLQGRVLGAEEDEVAAAASAVYGMLRGPAQQRFHSADEVRREVPFVLPLEDGRLVEGVFDLIVRHGERWTVVDFKTDVDLEARREHYERQLSWYVFALEQLTGSAVEGILLRV